MQEPQPQPPSVQQLEETFRNLVATLGADHPDARLARSSLAIRLRNLGKPERADALFADTGVCAHLRPVQDYIRSRGVRVLDVESLKSRFHLPAFVVVHSHRGTHDGAEHGLVCQQDHDALMGVHPELAGSARLIG